MTTQTLTAEWLALFCELSAEQRQAFIRAIRTYREIPPDQRARGLIAYLVRVEMGEEQNDPPHSAPYTLTAKGWAAIDKQERSP